MKHLNLKLIFFILVICVAGISCSGHCDDEDLVRREKEANMAAIKQTDSLEVD
ncbi:hypothetical protein SD960_10200 [Flavobacterium sp. MMLR14_040]|uniref:hypothetical protein n=1 Tax=Flavobacterium sp. MMLR14_040 TaxID=3093843 RepID=UPI00298F68A8|nr:hypothetical protein [Flavobacterium sp. MMLR14_040]MDW8850463.1 hypothetical protein [Flavobacterium sp. MMLR14_040]